jgi:phosphoribosyl-ATP pyrophosphohydrolase/phosphoribosyl-AMP cyclohydrolase/histidinol dehydrogenase
MSAALRRVGPDAVGDLRREPVDAATLAAASAIVTDVAARGEAALREHAERLGDLRPGEPLVRERRDLHAALESLPLPEREALDRTADRIRAFAAAQLDCLRPLSLAIPGGTAGHAVVPVEKAGCYAPGGRFPLPSSVLMTAAVARVAGVKTVWVASPRPATATLAAAAIAGVDAVLAVGGSQAIAAMAHGAGPVPACDVIAGPGNRFVTAAKQLVAGRVGIDMLAGPSELVVLADGTADAGLVAADLLAQAEHDPDAMPVLVTTSAVLADAVDAEIERQLRDLPTAATASAAVSRGMSLVVPTLDAGISVCDRLAPEHIEVMCADAAGVAARLRHFGALFVGPAAGEVLGDYGAGPNHVLPTGGTARFVAGLSVLTFLRVRTFLAVDDPAAASAVTRDAVTLARMEGLEAHARAAERRVKSDV